MSDWIASVCYVALIVVGVLYVLSRGDKCPHCRSRSTLSTRNMVLSDRERHCLHCGRVFEIYY